MEDVPECGLCCTELDDFDIGHKCGECRTAICYNCDMAVGYCSECLSEQEGFF